MGVMVLSSATVSTLSDVIGQLNLKKKLFNYFVMMCTLSLKKKKHSNEPCDWYAVYWELLLQQLSSWHSDELCDDVFRAFVIKM